MDTKAEVGFLPFVPEDHAGAGQEMARLQLSVQWLFDRFGAAVGVAWSQAA